MYHKIKSGIFITFKMCVLFVCIIFENIKNHFFLYVIFFIVIVFFFFFCLGAGLASVVVSFLMSTYYSVIIGYSIYYFFTAFKTEQPWIDCNNR